MAEPNDELADAERRYAEDMVAALRTGEPIRILTWEVVGRYPDSEFRIVFRVGGRPCTFGVVDRVWDEVDPANIDWTREVTYAYLRWQEALATGELPHRCRPDADGVTWLRLWDDWDRA